MHTHPKLIVLAHKNMKYKRKTSGKLNFIKVKNVRPMKDTIKKTKVNNRLRRNICNTYIDKGIVSKIKKSYNSVKGEQQPNF